MSLKDVSTHMSVMFYDEWHKHTPAVSGFCQYHPDVLGAFFHLARQIQGSCENKSWIRPSYLNFGVKSPYVDLS